MCTKIKNCFFNSCTILTLLLLPCIHGSESNNVCRFLNYRNPDVSDKPELIISMDFSYNSPYINASNDKLNKICHITSEDFYAKSLITPNSITDVFIDYDPLDHSIYKIYSNKVMKIFLGRQEPSVVYESNHFDESMDNVALDWITKNLFYVHEKSLKVTIHNSVQTLLNGNISSSIVKVFPEEGYLVVSRNKTDAAIERLDQDGGNSFTLYSTPNVRIHTMVLDYSKQDVYWTEASFPNVEEKRIRYVNLYGGEVKTFEIKNGSSDFDVRHLGVDRHYVYYVTKMSDGQKHLVRAWKSDGIRDQDFDISESDYDHSEVGPGEFGQILVLNDKELSRQLHYHPCVQKRQDISYDDICVVVHDRRQESVCKCMFSYSNWFYDLYDKIAFWDRKN